MEEERVNLLDKVGIKQFLIKALPLLTILVGVAVVSFSLGPYHSYDTDLEFEAATSIVNTGIPFVKAYGTAIDEPPLGFYIEALFLKVFGLSANTGVILVTLFGLGSVVIVYLIGKEMYGKTTGFFAAALFGLNPWQLVLSRSFLIDTPCLFFSLVCLFVGIIAIQKGSIKLALVTGLLFAAAILTKFYAAFILIPLLLFYLYSRPKQVKRILSQLVAFSLPALLFAILWYQIILGRTLLAIFQHNDFNDVIPASTGVVASPFFVFNFLANYGLGIYVISAIVFSLLLGFLLRKNFFVKCDLALIVAIFSVLSVNLYLGAVRNLNVPYFSALKYDFQALPFLILLGASLAAKSFSLLQRSKQAVKPKKLMLYLAVITAAILFFASLLSSIYSINTLSTRDYLQYRVEPQVDYGYALLTSTPLTANSTAMALQYWGFAAVLSGLLLASAQRIKPLLAKRMLNTLKLQISKV